MCATNHEQGADDHWYPDRGRRRNSGATFYSPLSKLWSDARLRSSVSAPRCKHGRESDFTAFEPDDSFVTVRGAPSSSPVNLSRWALISIPLPRTISMRRNSARLLSRSCASGLTNSNRAPSR